MLTVAATQKREPLSLSDALFAFAFLSLPLAALSSQLANSALFLAPSRNLSLELVRARGDGG